MDKDSITEIMNSQNLFQKFYIENTTSNSILIRLQDIGNTLEERLIEPLSSNVFKRSNQKNKYFIKLCYVTSEEKGPCFYIKPEGHYIIDEFMNLLDSEGNSVEAAFDDLFVTKKYLRLENTSDFIYIINIINNKSFSEDEINSKMIFLRSNTTQIVTLANNQNKIYCSFIKVLDKEQYINNQTFICELSTDIGKYQITDHQIINAKNGEQLTFLSEDDLNIDDVYMQPSVQYLKKNSITITDCTNGLVNETSNYIGIRGFYFINQRKSELIEIGQFFSFMDNMNFLVEVAHSRSQRFIFRINQKQIYHYREVGKLCFYSNNKPNYIFPEQIFSENESTFVNLKCDFSYLETKSKKLEEKNIPFTNSRSNNQIQQDDSIHKINFFNKTDFEVYVSIEKTNGYGSDEAFPIGPDSRDDWTRFKSNKLLIKIYFYNSKGIHESLPEYFIESPGEYELRSKNELIDLKKNEPIRFKTNVFISNETSENIFVIISENGMGNEDEFNVFSHGQDSWSRYSGEVKVSIRNYENKFTNKFLVPSPGFYKFMGDGILYDEENDEEYFDNPSLDVTKSKDVVYLHNQSDQALWVRISNNGMGSEDYFALEKNNADTWTRFKGNLYLEILEINQNTHKYEIFSPGKYYIHNNGGLVDDRSPYVYMQRSNEIKFSTPSRNETKIKLISLNSASAKKNIDICQNTEEAIKMVNSINEPQFRNLTNIDTSLLNLRINDKSNTNFLVENGNNSYASNFSLDENVFMIANELPEYEYYDNKKPVFTEGHFIDSYFPPELRIINSLNEKGESLPFHFYESSKKPHIDTKNIVFKRASEIFGTESNYYLFQDKIEANDCLQGKLGDCYLIGVLSSLARKPELIKSIFKTKSMNPYGFYEIYYYEGTERKIMFVDDYIPYDTKEKKPYFARANGNELWCILLEKALAKYENGYSNIHCGNSMCAFQFFTGACSRWVKSINYSIWDDLLYAAKNNHLMVCGSKGEDHSIQNDMGIFNQHCYSLLDVREYIYENGTSLKLLKLRNPWGYGEYKGDFSDNSNLWTEELKRHFDYDEVKGENGIFLIPYETFLNCYKDVTICYI